jgi:hypothetical protein
MKINFIILAAVIVLIMMSFKKEKFVEVMGFAGVTKNTTNIIINDSIVKIDEAGYTKQEKYNITPDLINDIVNLVRKYMSSKYGMCAQPIETNYIHKYVDKADNTKILYKTRMLFIKQEGFPYAFAISADVSVAGTAAPLLVGIYTQQMSDQARETIIPYTDVVGSSDFENFQDILAANIPKSKINGQENKTNPGSPP